MSSLERLGLPDSWIAAPLDEVTDISPSVPVEDMTDDQLVHFVPMAAVEEDFAGVDATQLRRLGDVRKGYTAFEAGDVLLAKITPCMENGKGGLVPTLSHRVAYGSTEFHVLRTYAGVANLWLSQFVSQPAFRNTARANMTGTAGQMRVPTKWLRTVKIPLPPAREQVRIVAKLEELLSDLDAGVAELKATQKKLAQYRQSLLKAAVEGTLTAEWRAKHTPTETGAQLLERILAERRARWEARQLAKFKEQGKAPLKDWQKKYPEPVQPAAADLTELPEGWVWATVDQLAYVGTGVTPLRSNPKFFEGGAIPWVTSGALNAELVAAASELVTQTALEQCRLEVFPAGSLLIAMYGEGKTRGKCAELIIDATINQAIAALVFDGTSKANKAFVKVFLLNSYERMRQQASGGVQPNLNLQIIKSIAVPLPSLAEQLEIVRQVAQEMGILQQLAASTEQGLKQSAAQRQNILRAAFAGQLVPQDPNDEPASVLLERIRAERAAREAVKKPLSGKAKANA